MRRSKVYVLMLRFLRDINILDIPGWLWEITIYILLGFLVFIGTLIVMKIVDCNEYDMREREFIEWKQEKGY